MSCQKLEDRNGIVTGAASGIGAATALHLASLGAKVALVDLNQAGLDEVAAAIVKNGYPEPMVVKCDVGDADQINRMVDGAAERFGHLDFSVHSAGILRRTKFTDITDEEWDLMMSINLRGVFLCCRAAAQKMLPNGKGSIVNVASLAGRTCSLLGGAHYTTAKHAVVGMSRHIARELAPEGIRVNAFCPGGTMTPMIKQGAGQEEIDTVAQNIPLRRWSSPEEQALAIAFLVSDDSSYMTGACLDSNGGSVML